MMAEGDRSSIEVAYERHNRDLDPQLVWRGKDDQDRHDLVVQAPPLYIQEKVHPKVLIDDLVRRTRDGGDGQGSPVEGYQPSMDLFSDFNGLPEGAERTDFYEHDANWSNRMILGDSLQVMASLAEREGLRGKVQCIYIDPPYGIKFNSNFQWSTTSRDVRDGNIDHITREPEQVKAFRDTWARGIHSYLSYLRDRLESGRDLLADTGSVFVQIGDENVHRVRALMDEVFGERNFVSLITTQTTTGFQANYIGNMSDFVLWYAKDKEAGRAQSPFYRETFALGEGNARWLLLNDLPDEERRELLDLLLEEATIDRDNNVSLTLAIPTDDLVPIAQPASPTTDHVTVMPIDTNRYVTRGMRACRRFAEQCDDASVFGPRQRMVRPGTAHYPPSESTGGFAPESSSSSGSSREQGVEVRLKFAVTVLSLSMYTVVTRVVLLKSPDRWLNVAEKPRTHFPAGA